MANYLERVASSAGRRAAIAKPPGSGPPLLPAGKDLSLPVEGSLSQFFEETTHERREATRSEAPISTAELAGDAIPLQVQRETKPPAPEPLSSEAPFTVHLPKTLRPISPTNVPPPVAGNLVPSAGPTEFTVEERVPRSSDSDMKQSAGLAMDTTAPPVRARSTVAGPGDERKPPAGRPIPGVDRRDELSHRVEPLQPAVSPVPMPPAVIGNGARQEPSRISIGSLEVLVNNHSPLNTVRPPASAPLRSEKVNLERRYLDRFRLRH